MKWFIRLALLASFAIPSASSAADAPKDLQLKIVLQSDTFTYTGAGGLEALAKTLAETPKKGPLRGNLPPAFPIALELLLTNTGKEALTIYIKGDPNLFEFTATGPAVKVAKYNVAQTLEFRLPQPTVIGAGKSIAIPVAMLEDGSRGRGRRTYFTEAGEYTLSASYTLADSEGGNAGIVKSEPVKLTVAEKK